MAPILTLKNRARESLLFRSRVLVAGAFVVVLCGLLVARMAVLEIVDYEHFKTLSHNNRVKIVPEAPTRGLIYDRNGIILAQNSPSYSLEVVPEDVRDMDATLAGLKTLIAIEEGDEKRFRSLLKKKRRFEKVPLRFHLSPEEVARFAVNRHRFPGVDIEARLTRSYPLRSLGVHLIGYVGRINEEELQRVDSANYAGTTHIGKTGVEQAYEDQLHGRVGYQHVETNAQGRVVRSLERIAPVPGKDLHLTIDASLQMAAEAALGEENGAIVAIEPGTGDVLALASMPSFDPNEFVNGIDAKSYRALMRSPHRPLFNRALHGQYPPGSTLKPFVALAGLELDAEAAHDQSWCGGYYRLKGHSHKYRDWKRGGHGRVDLERAIVESCDVYFYQLSLELGIDRMHDYLARFGFGTATGIDLRGEVSGLLPSSAWKRRARNQPWFPGETLITGIGQGFTLTTPLQLASATATLAMRGLVAPPRAVSSIVDRATGLAEAVPRRPAVAIDAHDDANWKRVVGAMEDVVHGARGTARKISQGATYRMAGKTGTAQVFGIGQEEEYDESTVPKKLRDHGLFISFAPVDSPRIAVAVVVENGGGGSRAAAPLARQVMDHFLLDAPPVDRDERLRLTALQGAE